MSHTVTFGELLLRLSTPGFKRFGQADSFDATFGGGESNVAASLAAFGHPVEFVSRIPDGPIGDAAVAHLRAAGVGTRFLERGGDRMGIYFLETGASARASQVVYDRAGSGMATVEADSTDWWEIFKSANWYHFTGITPALSARAAAVCLESVQAATRQGVSTSCDLNYRAKLWRYGKRAGEVMPALVEHCRVIVGNEEDAARVFGISAPDADITAGQVEADAYLAVCRGLMERFPKCQIVAITLRGSKSASHNTWSGVLYDGKKLYTTRTYDIIPIVDRVGAGDAFAGGLIHRLLTDESDLQAALDFAVAASCLKHSVPGDFNRVSTAEVQKLVAGDASGRVSR